MNYLFNEHSSLELGGGLTIENNKLLESIELSNDRIKKIYETSTEIGVDIFETLGLRNLSGFVGETFSQSLIDCHSGLFVKNPHQDGYPDVLCVDTKEKKEWFEQGIERKEGKIYVKNKPYFSNYQYGAFEVKATCGETPPAKKLAKPLIGEERIHILKKFDWKAHHRKTNKLISVLWDFVGGIPTIVVVFYRDDLLEDDWGNIAHPKEGGGRTTSVSVMKTSGVKKLCENWLAIINNQAYIEKLDKWTKCKEGIVS